MSEQSKDGGPDAYLAALRELVSACAYVQPISGTMAGDTILNMRRAFRFMAAVERAQKLLDGTDNAPPLPRIGWIIDGKIYEDRVEADRAYRNALPTPPATGA